MPKRIIRLPIASDAKTCGECLLLASGAEWCMGFDVRVTSSLGPHREPNRAQECLDAEVTEEADHG